jgi:hypothetical protein
VTRRLLLGAAAVALALAGCSSSPSTKASIQSGGTDAGGSTTAATTTTTLPPCSLSAGSTVPVSDVCSSAGAPHFDTPQAAMEYLAAAWNSQNVREIDYVTDPAGRQQLNAMASSMPSLQFKSCTQNPAGDYTCYFSHPVVPSTSPTTYPNPGGYPPGEAVFTVAPADGPGWYLTFVIHCG